jgi:hypothetical protein
VSDSRKPSHNVRLSFRDGREQSFTSYSGKEITSKWRNIGATWPGKYEETPFSVSLEKGWKLVDPEGNEHAVDEIYLDLRLPYDASKRDGGDKPAAAKAPAKKAAEKPKRKAVDADPFA